MRGIGRGRITGNDRRNLFRLQDRGAKVMAARPVHHTSFLPSAREYPGRIMYVAGSIKAFYWSNGSVWTAI